MSKMNTHNMTIRRLLALYVVFALSIFVAAASISWYEYERNRIQVQSEFERQITFTNQSLADEFSAVRISAIALGQRALVKRFGMLQKIPNSTTERIHNNDELTALLSEELARIGSLSVLQLSWRDGNSFSVGSRIGANMPQPFMASKDNQQVSSGWVLKGSTLYYLRYFPTDSLDYASYSVLAEIKSDHLYDLFDTAAQSQGLNQFLMFEKNKVIALDKPSSQVMDVAVQHKSQSGERTEFDALVSGRRKHFIIVKNDESNTWLVSYYDVLSAFNQSASVLVSYIVGVTLLMSVAVAIFVLFNKKIIRNMNTLEQGLKVVGQGDYSYQLNDVNDPDFRYVFNSFNFMVRQTKDLLTTIETERSLKSQAEVKQLQSQINPHFLYNSLFYIVSMARRSPEAVVSMAQHMASYYRYQTQSSGAGVVPIKDELELARHYLSVMSLRKKIHFEIVEGIVGNPQILPLIIQPIIENAIYHGIESRKAASRVSISVYSGQHALRIVIVDDGAVLTQPRVLQSS